MFSIAEVVGQLVAVPKPVICLDTCDILEVVQCLDWEKPYVARSTTCVKVAEHLRMTLAADPEKAIVVITELVAIEWNQNIDNIRQNAIQFLSRVDDIVLRSYRAANAAGTILPAFKELSGSALVADLVTISNALLSQAIRLDLDPVQIDLAVKRVMDKRRPSQDGHLKDSIHFEHYLALARQLRAAGFAEEIVFTSRNRKDFWDGPNPSIHPDLDEEINHPEAKVRFFGSLEAALKHLRLY